jgi:hypothetical protein
MGDERIIAQAVVGKQDAARADGVRPGYCSPVSVSQMAMCGWNFSIADDMEYSARRRHL